MLTIFRSVAIMNQSNMHLVDSCPDRDAYSLFHQILDVCCDTTHNSDQLAAQDHLWSDRTFCSKFVSSVWPTETAFRDACQQFIQLFYQMGCQLVDLEVQVQKQPFANKVKLILQECLEVRQKELFKSLVFKTVTSRLAYLHNYDWQVSVVMSSDRMSSIKVPVLKLSLQLHAPSGHCHGLDQEESSLFADSKVLFSHSSSSSSDWTRAKAISFEFTKVELTSFIQTLEEARHAFGQAVAV